MLTLRIPEPSAVSVAREALPILHELQARDQEWADERERQRRLRTSERGYDWQSYCRHGSFVGDPYGPDYMCGLCEDGISVREEALAIARVRVQNRLSAAEALFLLDRLGVFTRAEDELRDALTIRITQRLY